MTSSIEKYIDRNILNSVDEDFFVNCLMPFIKTSKKKYILNSCSVDKFEKRFNINVNRDILNTFDEIHKRFLNSNQNLYLAGGKVISSILNKEEDNDFDIFGFSIIETVEPIIIETVEPIDNNTPAELISRIEDDKFLKHINSTSFLQNYIYKEKYSIQFILKDFSCVQDILENFDIRVCCFAYQNGKFFWLKGALHDLRDKKIVLNKLPLRGVKCIKRIAKYVSKGYETDELNYVLCSFFTCNQVRKNAIILNNEEYENALGFTENFIFGTTNNF